jgi:large subunit ribosomal protein L13
MKTYSPRPRDIERRWYVIDAGGAVLGRLSTEVAAILRGKHKPIFAPHMDVGDHVIVVNAKDVRLTGGKEETKVAYRHSGHPGGITATKYGKLLADKPAYAVEKAVRGMLPKNRLGRAMVKKLQVYAGPEHPHQAQKPEPLKLGEVPRWSGLPETRHAVEAPSRASKPKPTSGRTARPASKPAGTRSTGSAASGPAEEPGGEGATPTAKRSTAKRSTAKRGAAKPTTAKTATAKRSTAKRSTARRTKKEE